MGIRFYETIGRMLDNCEKDSNECEKMEKAHPFLYLFSKRHQMLLTRRGAYCKQIERLMEERE